MAANQSSLPQSVRYELTADTDPGLLDRLLAPFARRGLVPDQVKCRRFGGAMEARFDLHDMPGEMVHLVEGNLRQVVGVRRLSVELRAAVRAAA